jgi:hypothetical protein
MPSPELQSPASHLNVPVGRILAGRQQTNWRPYARQKIDEAPVVNFVE